MSGATGRTREEFTVYNVMLPRKYYPGWQGNLFERRCKACPLFCALPMAVTAGYWEVAHVLLAFLHTWKKEAVDVPIQTGLGAQLTLDCRLSVCSVMPMCKIYPGRHGTTSERR